MHIVYMGHVGMEGTAMAIHTRNIADILSRAGHRVSFLSCAIPGNMRPYPANDRYVYTYARRRTKLWGLRTLETWYEEITGSQLRRLLRQKCRTEQVDLVILYGHRGEAALIAECRRRGIKIIADRTDWFEADDKDNRFERWYCRYYVDRCMERTDRALDGVIAISDYLARHYRALGVRVFQMPPVFPFPERVTVERQPIGGERLRLVYAGSLGQSKDDVRPVIDAVRRINAQGEQLRLDLVGISQSDLARVCGDAAWQESGVFVHGRVPNETARELVRRADFSVLLRQNKRYAKAGFSTKFAESMISGVPVLCTAVGGADALVRDGVDGVLLPDNRIDTVENCLRRLLALPEGEIEAMKKRALTRAEQLFDSALYVERLDEFIRSL